MGKRPAFGRSQSRATPDSVRRGGHRPAILADESELEQLPADIRDGLDDLKAGWKAMPPAAERLRQRVPRAPARTMPRQVALFGERFDVVFDRIATLPGFLGGFADGHAPMIAGNLQYLYR